MVISTTTAFLHSCQFPDLLATKVLSLCEWIVFSTCSRIALLFMMWPCLLADNFSWHSTRRDTMMDVSQEVRRLGTTHFHLGLDSTSSKQPFERVSLDVVSLNKDKMIQIVFHSYLCFSCSRLPSRYLLFYAFLLAWMNTWKQRNSLLVGRTGACRLLLTTHSCTNCEEFFCYLSLRIF